MTKLMSFRLTPAKLDMLVDLLGAKDKTDALRQIIDDALVDPKYHSIDLVCFSVSEISEKLGVGLRTVYDWIENKLLKVHDLNGLTIFPQDLLSYLRQFNDEIPPAVLEMFGLTAKSATNSGHYFPPKMLIKKYQIKKSTFYDWLAANKLRKIQISPGRYLVSEKSVRRRLQKEKPSVTKL